MITQKDLQETWPTLAERLWHIFTSPKNPDINEDEYREWQLDSFNAILDTEKPWAHGVEHIRLPGGYEITEDRTVSRSWFYGDTIAYYVNRGDSYAATILYDLIEREWFITCTEEWERANVQPYRIEEARQKWAEFKAVPLLSDELLPALSRDWEHFEEGTLHAQVIAWFQRQYGEVTYYSLIGEL